MCPYCQDKNVRIVAFMKLDASGAIAAIPAPCSHKPLRERHIPERKGWIPQVIDNDDFSPPDNAA